MTWIILLAGAGIALLTMEIIIPGGILGAIGLVSILAACVVSFSEFGALGGLIGTAAIFILTGLIIWIEFKLLSKTTLGKRAFLTKSVDSTSSKYGEEAKQLIGKEAVAETTLSPSGYITIEGKRHEAFCQTGLIEAGTSLKVIGADSFRLIVALNSANDSIKSE